MHPCTVSKNEIFLDFENEKLCLQGAKAIMADSRLSKSSKNSFFESGGHMKTITRTTYLGRIIELDGTPDIKNNYGD